MTPETITTLSLPYYTGKNKTVRVFVPEHEDGELLPAVYMTDGQNLFEDDRPYQFGCWYTREAVREEQKTTGKAAIIVGVHNDEGFAQRGCELTPAGIGPIQTPDTIPEEVKKLLIPQGEKFDDFVVNTVMPAIEAQFPVAPGRNNTAFCGSSSGGLQAYFTVLSHPDKFCLSGVFSPAFPLYSTEDILRWTSAQLTESMPYLYFYSGGADELEQEIRVSTEIVYDALVEFYPPERLNAVILPENPHHERAWAPVFRDFLHTFLFLI